MKRFRRLRSERRARAAIHRATMRGTREACRLRLDLRHGYVEVFPSEPGAPDATCAMYVAPFTRAGSDEDGQPIYDFGPAEGTLLWSGAGRHNPEWDTACVHCGGQSTCDVCVRGDFVEEVPW